MTEWMYMCSCNGHNESLISNLQPIVNMSTSLSFENSFPSCIHIKAVKSLVTLLDSLNEIYPEYDFHGEWDYYYYFYD